MSAPSERSATPAPVGRLAPSPTGRLHLGHARSFLLAWALARSRGGRVLLRLEDLDRGRVKPDLIEACIEDLRWLGLDWDGPALLQSEGEAGLREALARLVDGGEAYPCVCTRREIELAVSAPHPGEEGPRYPGTCRGRFRDLFEAERWSGRRAAWRFAVPDGPIELRDELRGRFVIDVASEQGDFPLTSRDGQIAYQLAVVVDDARQGVTEVVRGDDLLSSAGRQAWLQHALGLPRPAWYHLPLVLDAEGRRLAKRSPAHSLGALRAAGLPPEAVVAWCARSAGLDRGPRLTAAEFVAHFRLDALPREPLRLPPDPLAALLQASASAASGRQPEAVPPLASGPSRGTLPDLSDPR